MDETRFLQVLIIDPTDPQNNEILKLIESFVIHTAPIRVGIILNVSDSHSLNGLQDAGVAMQCALNYVTQSKDPATAIAFLRSVMKEAKEHVTVEDVKEQIRKQFGEDPNDILGNNLYFLLKMVYRRIQTLDHFYLKCVFR